MPVTLFHFDSTRRGGGQIERGRELDRHWHVIPIELIRKKRISVINLFAQGYNEADLRLKPWSV